MPKFIQRLDVFTFFPRNPTDPQRIRPWRFFETSTVKLLNLGGSSRKLSRNGDRKPCFVQISHQSCKGEWTSRISRRVVIGKRDGWMVDVCIPITNRDEQPGCGRKALAKIDSERNICSWKKFGIWIVHVHVLAIYICSYMIGLFLCHTSHRGKPKKE